jgi:hypothetical protein
MSSGKCPLDLCQSTLDLAMNRPVTIAMAPLAAAGSAWRLFQMLDHRSDLAKHKVGR